MVVRQERGDVHDSGRRKAIPIIKDYSLVCAWRRSNRERLHNAVLDTDTTRCKHPPLVRWNFVNALFQTICPILYHWLKGPDAFIRGEGSFISVRLPRRERPRGKHFDLLSSGSRAIRPFPEDCA